MRQLFRPPVKLPREQMSMAVLVSAAFFVAGYDLNILGLAMPKILPEFGISESEQGQTIALLRLSVLLAFPLAALADKFGRKAMLAITIVGSGVFTLMTAFAATYEQFMAAQALVRVFGYAQDMIAIVMISEEVDDRARGWALGLLAAVGAAGAGSAAIVYAGVDVVFGDWRALYVIGALPLFLIAWLWRRLPETRRFANLKAAGKLRRESSFGGVRNVIELFRTYPARSWALAAAVGAFAFGSAPALVLNATFLQEVRGFSPGEVSLLVIAGGTFAMLGNFVAGRLSDRHGRRAVLAIGAMMTFIGFGILYCFEDHAVVAISWTFALFGFFAAEVVLSAYGAELFSTAHRSGGSGLRTTATIIGGGLGLFAKDGLFILLGSHSLAFLVLLPAIPLSLVIVYLTLPETSGKTLEQISPDHHPHAGPH
ncbi:MAG TPA: MFS transporter [Micropepsaceae bacterium]|nr:MFS transporter [Micropepsaceae bacterium]